MTTFFPYHPCDLCKTDACNYGTGAALYQLQKDERTGKHKWFLIDLYSRQLPQQLRHAHSMVHEATAIVQACQHWQFHLLKRKFIISTDNKPISLLFTEKYRELSEITQKQILRLRIAIRPFSFEMLHVEGAKNELADSLSRFTSEIIKADKDGKFPDAFEGHIPSDTHTKLITDKDKERLRKQWEKENKTKFLSVNNIIHDTDELKTVTEHLDDILNHINNNNDVYILRRLLNSSKNDHTTYQTIKKIQDKQYKDTLHNYRLHANITEKQQITDILNSATNENVLDSDETSFNSPAIHNFIGNMHDLQTITNKMSTKTLEGLVSHQHYCQKLLYYEDKCTTEEDTTDIMDKTDNSNFITNIISTQTKETQISDLYPMTTRVFGLRDTLV